MPNKYEGIDQGGLCPPVLVVSRNYSTSLGVARSLGAAGFIVDVIASVTIEGYAQIPAASKYVRNCVELVADRNNEFGKKQLIDAIIDYSNSLNNDFIGLPLLFVADDDVLAIVDTYRDELKTRFILPTIGGGKESFATYTDKSKQLIMASDAGLLIPATWVISLEEKIEIPRDIILPCFVKPKESSSGRKLEMAKCNTKEELMSHLTGLQKVNCNRKFIVQEYLNISNEIDFSGVCIDDEIIIPGIIRKLEIAQQERGVTLVGRMHKYTELDVNLRDSIENFIKNFHYRGMFDMELNIVGDKVYFNELNLRSGGPSYSYFLSGVNLPAIYAREAFGLERHKDEETIEVYGKTFVNDKAAWEDYAYGFINKAKLKKLISSPNYTLLVNEDDYMPGNVFSSMMSTRFNATRKTVQNRKFRNKYRHILGPIKRTLLGYPQTRPWNRRNAKKPRVMVVGRNFCSIICMTRSLGEAGYDVEVLRVFQDMKAAKDPDINIKPEMRSKYVKAYYVCVTGRKDEYLADRLIELADRKRKMLLIPADDDLTAAVTDKYLDRLSEYYLLSNINNKAGEICKLMAKDYQKDLAKKWGLPVIDSVVIKTEKGLFTIPENIKYPCFVKPNISNLAAKRMMRKCDNSSELEAAIAEFTHKKDNEFIVEDFVEIDKEYALLGLSLYSEVVIPGLIYAEETGKEEHNGVTLKGKVLSTSEMSDFTDKVRGFVKSLDLVGLFDVDFIQDTKGNVYFVEMNMRFGASGYAITQCGVNLPALFAGYMFNGNHPDEHEVLKDTNRVFVSEKVVYDELCKGRITLAEAKEKMNDADITFIRNQNDPAPFRILQRKMK